MTNITAFLIVLTLTGPPVASVVCVAQCRHEPATSGHCHADMATIDGPMISASDRCNDPSISESPYVIEHRSVTGAAVLTTALLSTAQEPVKAVAPAGHATAADSWLKPFLVLRI